MAVEISPAYANVTGAGLTLGGGYALYRGSRHAAAATQAMHFTTTPLVVPALEQFEKTTKAATTFLKSVQTGMESSKLPGHKTLKSIPVVGGIADDAARALRLGGAARVVSRVDEKALVDASIKLSDETSKLVHALHTDMPRIAAIRSSSIKGGLLLAGGLIAAAGGIALLASANLEVG